MSKRSTPNYLFLFTILFATLCVRVEAQTVYYVDSATGNDTHAGTSWGTAFRNLTKAIAVANSSAAAEVDIWVTEGTYTPVEGIATLPADLSDTSFTFFRGNGVGKALKVYGGFVGTEASIAARDTSHHTYLDAHIGTTSYSYHVSVIAGLSAIADSTVIDGFTMRNGDANGGFKTYNGISVDGSLGGGMALYNDSSATLVVRNCIFRSSISISGGAGMYTQSVNALITGCSFISNIALGYGAGMYNSASSPTIINCDFISNKADHDLSDNSWGGGMYNASSSPVISKCRFISNSAYGDADVHGGAIFNESSSPIIDSCSFTANTALVMTSANSFGGAIYNDLSSPIITNSSFTQNTSYAYGDDFDDGGLAYGGGIYNNGGIPVITNCNFTSNGAYAHGWVGSSGIGSGYSYGGAMYNTSSSPVITHCSFTTDSAYGYHSDGYQGFGYGGGIYNYSSSPVIRNCSFNAEVGAGDNFGYGGGIYSATTCNVTLDSCKFTGNISINNGGAIYHYDGKLIATHCVFNSNSSGNGGAIRLGDPGPGISSITGYGNVFAKNTASSGGGGAISTYMNGGLDTLINNLFVSNKDLSATGGGALHLIGSSHYIFNNTFYADSTISGGGGAIYSYLGPVFTIANNIFYNNYGAGTGVDTSMSAAGTLIFSNNLYSSTNPLFVNAANPLGADGIWATADDGLQLQKCSPARNAGANVYVVPGETTDITSSPRIEGTAVDIGAYETNPVGAITGIHDICLGSTTTLSDTSAGGVWISSNTAIATISSSGFVTTLATGTDIILYVVSGFCGTDTALTTIVVTPSSATGVITGIPVVCVGATTMLGDTLSGGAWSASNGHATVSGGIVTGITPGIDTIIYTNSCGLASTSRIVTINALPSAGTITGLSSVCAGFTISLTDLATGGIWSAANTNATVSGGTVTGVTAGTDTIKYSVTNTCGNAVATSIISVNPLPAPITGTVNICTGSTATFSDATTGGAWSSGTTSVATITPGGIATGVSGGTSTITFTLPTGCLISTTVTVNPSPASITGTVNVCVGSTAAFSDATTGGTWSSGTISVATVVSGTGLLRGISPGTSTITYQLSTGCSASAVITVANCHLGLDETSANNKTAKVYPNPATDEITIEHAGGALLMVYNMLGQQVYKNAVKLDKEIMNLDNLPGGTYLFQFMGGDGNSTNVTIVKK